MLYLGDKKATLFKGDRRPVSLYLGDKKVTGYEYAEQTGEHLTFENTYNDSAWLKINGKTVEIGEGEKSPDNPYELKSVGDDGGFDLVSCGKNLFYAVSGNSVTNHGMTRTYDLDKQTMTIDGTATQESGHLNVLVTNYKVKAGRTYKLRAFLISGSGTQSVILSNVQSGTVSLNQSNNYTRTVTATQDYENPITAGFYWYNGSVAENFTVKIMISEVDVDEYEPHKSQTVHFPYTLRSLPNGVADYAIISQNEKRLIKNISNAIILNGSNEAWSNPSESTTTYRLICINWCVDKNVLLSTANSGLAVSADGDYAIIPSAAGTGADTRSICFYSNNWLYIRVEKEKVDAMEGGTVLDKFKNYLNLYPVTLIYQLAEPEIIPIECEDVKTYYPYTNIYTISTVQPTLDGTFRVTEI